MISAGLTIKLTLSTDLKAEKEKDKWLSRVSQVKGRTSAKVLKYRGFNVGKDARKPACLELIALERS